MKKATAQKPWANAKSQRQKEKKERGDAIKILVCCFCWFVLLVLQDLAKPANPFTHTLSFLANRQSSINTLKDFHLFLFSFFLSPTNLIFHSPPKTPPYISEHTFGNSIFAMLRQWKTRKKQRRSVSFVPLSLIFFFFFFTFFDSLSFFISAIVTSKFWLSTLALQMDALKQEEQRNKRADGSGGKGSDPTSCPSTRPGFFPTSYFTFFLLFTFMFTHFPFPPRKKTFGYFFSFRETSSAGIQT